MSFFARLKYWLRADTPRNGNHAASRALALSSEVIAYMREASNSNDPAKALMADIWLQKNNIPYMTTMYEASQEMNSATKVGNADNDN